MLRSKWARWTGTGAAALCLASSVSLTLPQDANAANRKQLMIQKSQVANQPIQQSPNQQWPQQSLPAQRSPVPVQPSTALVAGEQPPMTPLDRLKARSAQQRWAELNKQTSTVEPAPNRPVPEPSDAPQFEQISPPTLEKPALLNRDDVDPASQLPPYRSNASERFPIGPLAGGQEKAIGGTPTDAGPAVEPVRDPKQLRKLTSIMPFYDYIPAGSPGFPDVCHNLCPRPNDDRCKNCPDGKCPECPEEVPLTVDPYAAREIAHMHYCWEASDLYYNPLYFEDFELERYGHTHHCLVQPFASAGKFYLQLLGIPYQATIHPLWECQSPLGFYRPGEFAPFKNYQIPWNTRAAVAQGAFATGMVYLIP